MDIVWTDRKILCQDDPAHLVVPVSHLNNDIFIPYREARRGRCGRMNNEGAAYSITVLGSSCIRSSEREDE